MKKTILFLFISIILLSGCSLQSSEKEGWLCDNSSCNFCVQRGGKIFAHSFSSNCEFKAKDAGKACTYNDECTKKLCLYPDKNSTRGSCADYNSIEGEKCTRKRGEAVKCYIIISYYKEYFSS